MQDIKNEQYVDEHNNEIDLLNIINVLLDKKWTIFYLTTFISFIGVVYSLTLPNIYESKTLLDRNDASSSISSSLGAYNGIAGLAGISLPSSSSKNNSEKAIKKINSLSFFENSIYNNIHLPDLMAVKSWDSKTNTMIYDEKIYDVTNNTWIRDYSHPRQPKPSAQESFHVFKTEHLRLNEDKISGFITLSIKHQSPYIAKQWTELVFDEINSFYRQKNKLEAERSISYLNQQISIADLSEIKLVLAQLLQEEIKNLTLIEANEAYVFDYIDPPVLMELKSEPKRSTICFSFALLGIMLSILLVLTKHYIFNKIAL